jgi:hypothetical protein
MYTGSDFVNRWDNRPVPNLNLIREVLSVIKENPERWNQSIWMSSPEPKFTCGTAMCVAGHAVSISDLDIKWVYSRWDKEYRGTLEDGRMIAKVAQELLGLTENEANTLFDANNTFAELKTIAKQIAERAGEKLELGKYMKAKKKYALVSSKPWIGGD